MAGIENLRTPTTEEAREIGRLGGIASGEARRKRKTFKEQLLVMLSDGTLQDDILNSLTKQAKRGNIKAFEVIRDTIGEKPSDQIEITDKTADPLADMLGSLTPPAPAIEEIGEDEGDAEEL